MKTGEDTYDEVDQEDGGTPRFAKHIKIENQENLIKTENSQNIIT